MSIPRLFSYFWKAPGTRPGLVVSALLMATVTEGLGFAALLPMIGLAADSDGASSSPLNRGVRQAMEAIGLPIELGALLIVVTFILVLRSLLRMWAMFYVGATMADVATGIRRRLISNLLRVRWPYLVSQPLGRIANIASSEAMRAGRAYTLVAELIANTIQAVVMTVIAFFVSWHIAVGSIVLGALIALSLHVFVRGSKRTGKKQTMRTKDLLIYLSDTLGNLKPVRAMGREAAFAQLFEGRIRTLRKSIRGQTINREALNNLQDVFSSILLGVGFWLAYVVWKIPIAELVVSGLLLFRAIASTGKLQKAYQTAVEMESAWYHSEDMIAEAAADPEPNPGTAVASFQHMIRLEGVRFEHGNQKVLRGIDLEIPVGALTVLTGPSGAGKTTIIDLVLGLYRPSAGRVTIDGVDLTEIDLRSWRSQVGYVPQELVLFHDSIRANLTMGDKTIGDDQLEEALRTADAWDFVSRLPQGLDTVVGERGGKLSGGQRQRIALARGMVMHPRLLVLDEVTSALDPTTAAEITDNIRRLSHRMTIVSITHRPEFLEVADRIYEIAAGLATERPAPLQARLEQAS